MTPRQTNVGHVGQTSDSARAVEAVRVAVAVFHQRVATVLDRPREDPR